MRKMNAMGEDWLDDHLFSKPKKSRAGLGFLVFLLVCLVAYILVIGKS